MKSSIDRHGGDVIQFIPRAPRLIVHISARDGRLPIGRTRPLMLRESDLARLVEVAERLEAGG
jgi:hypothetical protein